MTVFLVQCGVNETQVRILTKITKNDHQEIHKLFIHSIPFVILKKKFGCLVSALFSCLLFKLCSHLLSLTTIYFMLKWTPHLNKFKTIKISSRLKALYKVKGNC